jgi:hypothetical protein
MMRWMAIGAMALAACNAYDPDLGDRPFRCGEGEKRCPDGYSCVVYGPGMELCEAESGQGSPDGGGGDFACMDDSDLEPNNDESSAVATPIPNMSSVYALLGLAICPATDLDFFAFGVDTTGKNFRVDIATDASGGELRLDILNDTGNSIRTGEPVDGDEQLLRAEVPNMPIGTYFVQVSSESGGENNYSIDMELAGP